VAELKPKKKIKIFHFFSISIKRHSISNPYIYMKNFLLLAVWLLCRAALWAEAPSSESGLPFNWSLLWSGSWEDFPQNRGTLHNRAELKINWVDFSLREQVLDRRSLADPDKAVTNLNGGLYHPSTGSRLLFGTIDEWGLPARIRNPWIRSPPYSENHKPVFADLKTAASSTKEDEAYLYLSAPVWNISQDVKLRPFVFAQTEINGFKPALGGGLDFTLPDKANLLLDFFYTGTTLAPTKSTSWFSDTPPLPEREFKLYAAALLFNNPLLSISSDFALSQTFAVGTDIYCNLGLTLTPKLPFGARERPLSFSFAADGAGPRFVYRDGANHGEGVRAAAKIEWKGRYNYLVRFNTVLRSPGFGEDFTRSSSGLYFRFPSKNIFGGDFPVRLARISLNIDRNAENHLKISDGLSASIGFFVNLRQFSINTPLGFNFSGSVKRITACEGVPSPYPVSDLPWIIDSMEIKGEITWSPLNYQFKTGLEFYKNAKNVEKRSFSAGAAIRFKQGRLALKAVYANPSSNWEWTASWRLEIP
jgi:hypothetical protein